ncbi:hypothetical protein N7532_005043 [Penicillium argentinense]|uniref:Uncharacterized protein n=1 Tax=Penicillium argentinense TaxID=1131581 RepID=A0A9W9KAK0_9EURO|nr:uncharacterized protein N7532_005043 [Penicillium argentinense]KAJ5098042.1 hypothetical protein N7532_005043 [Penicillium argentinense]
MAEKTFPSAAGPSDEEANIDQLPKRGLKRRLSSPCEYDKPEQDDFKRRKVSGLGTSEDSPTVAGEQLAPRREISEEDHAKRFYGPALDIVAGKFAEISLTLVQQRRGSSQKDRAKRLYGPALDIIGGKLAQVSPTPVQQRRADTVKRHQKTQVKETQLNLVAVQTTQNPSSASNVADATPANKDTATYEDNETSRPADHDDEGEVLDEVLDEVEDLVLY